MAANASGCCAAGTMSIMTPFAAGAVPDAKGMRDAAEEASQSPPAEGAQKGRTQVHMPPLVRKHHASGQETIEDHAASHKQQVEPAPVRLVGRFWREDRLGRLARHARRLKVLRVRSQRRRLCLRGKGRGGASGVPETAAGDDFRKREHEEEGADGGVCREHVAVLQSQGCERTSKKEGGEGAPA